MGEFRDYLNELSEHKEIISEMAIAGYGDWKPSKEMIGTKSAFIIKSKYIYRGEIISRTQEKFQIYKFKLSDDYVIGNFKVTSTEDEIFEIVSTVKLKEHKRIAALLKIKNRLMNVDAVQTQESKQGDGIASKMYEFLVLKENFVLLGDELQYFGARKLWSRLSKHMKLKCSIVDIEKMNILEEDVIITQGTEDYEFDDRVWDYTPAKKDIRLILTGVELK